MIKNFRILVFLGLIIVFASCEKNEQELEMQEVQKEVKVEETQQTGLKSSAVFLKQGSFNLSGVDKTIKSIYGSNFNNTDLFQFTVLRNNTNGTFYVKSFLSNGDYDDIFYLIPESSTKLTLAIRKSQLNSNVTSLKLMCTSGNSVSGNYIILGTD